MANANILIVDDTPANLRLLTQMLTDNGYTVHAAKDGPQAWRLMQHTLPDLILLDIMMPGMSGYDVCRRLKEDALTRDVPVIFLSALDEIANKTRAFAAGGVDYVTKPFQAEEVLARVRAHLTIRELTQRLQQFNQELEQMVQQRTAELEAAYRRLEKLDKAKSDFINITAHELRTPLTVLHGYAAMMCVLESVKDDPVLGEMARGVLGGADRLRQVVNTMLDVVKIDHGQVDVCLEKVNMRVSRSRMP